MKAWFITGASRGFGLEIARQALERGDSVVATARDPRTVEKALAEGGDRLLALPLDVTDEQQVRQAADAAVDRFGRIDVLVNNAGRGLLGAVEEASDDEAQAVFGTNVFGLLSVTRAVLPVMRHQRSGRVLNISSVGGFTVGAGWGVYGATKFAVEGLSEAMRAELAPLGIAVTVVEPGVFRTDFLDSSSLHRTHRRIDDYTATAGGTRVWAEQNNHAQPGDPVKAATAMITVADSPEPPTRIQLGADCVARVEAKLEHVASELAQWRDLALSTVHA
ncbi:oxidoreductase [Streptomyces iranensis]|uniref:NAD(P)-dependent dehydrogenase (Short-subunit alcohol dehydrogenase family) n=1 Tax=Streptomyces iranensis TaxID=576784 RepID=A0A060ZYS0_9ACTN|nr:oxidoreductase [Streptomyces iranensis]MBP2066158.1 NAD(P)-dependent dehydrogenase (short-subunit alcohol dehydrogenase family) [Streptomyces iranensis]CDR13181.1 Short-chain dehydrogenase family protein [Streptomyces iranensis]